MSRASFPVLALAAPLLAAALSGCVPLVAAGAVAGVSAARQERTVGNAIDDVRIRNEIEGRLVRESADNFVNVSVTAVEGRVLLTGRVDSPQTRLNATRVAWSAEGVRKVDNAIEVTDESGWLQRPEDIYLRTRVAAALLGTEGVKDRNYTVDCVNGVVYLTGVGQSQAEMDKAVAVAQGISGVKRVENYAVLKNDPARYGFAGPYTAQN